MKLETLASAAQTEKELEHPVTGEPTGVFFSGFTPDSSEYKAIERSIVGPDKSMSMIVDRKKGNRVELDADMAANKKKIVTKALTGIRGIDDWEFSQESKAALLGNPQYAWMLEQWTEHLDDRANFFMTSQNDASYGVESLDG